MENSYKDEELDLKELLNMAYKMNEEKYRLVQICCTALKDIYNLATLFRIYTILPILAIVISYSQHSLGMLQFLPAFIGMFATISAFAYDEQSNFDSFAMTLPINRKDMVISKYVLALVCIFASMLLSMVLGALILMFSQEQFQTVELSGFLAECRSGVSVSLPGNWYVIRW